MLDVNKISQEVKDFGCYKINGFFNNDEVAKAKEITKGNIKGYSAKNGILSHKGGKKKSDQYVPHTILSLLIKLVKFDFRKLSQGLYAINFMKKRPQIKEICDRVFETKNKLSFIDGYEIKDNEKIIWHTDKLLSNNLNDNKIIFFIYLDNVEEKSGSMGYIKGSHKITHFIKKGLINEKLSIKNLDRHNKLPLDGANFSLEFLKDLIQEKNNYDYLVSCLKDKKIIDNFLEKIETIISNGETGEFFYRMNQGDAIIFDQSGIHGGSEVKENKRSVMRFAFNKI